MKPGYLHFDLRRGLTADMLIASMIFSKKHTLDIFNSLNLKDISISIDQDAALDMKGLSVRFYINNQPIDGRSFKADKNFTPKNYIWHDKDTKITKTNLNCKNTFLHHLAMNEQTSLPEIKNFILSHDLKPEITNLAVKIIDELSCPLFVEQKLGGRDALWLICHVLMLCGQLDFLDPKYVSANRISLGQSKTNSSKLNSLDIIHHILLGTPFNEIKDNVPADIVAAAFLKVVVGHFGLRGLSTILNIGVGISSALGHEQSLIIAHWCEAEFPNSINDLGKLSGAKIKNSYEMSALVPTRQSMDHLALLLAKSGAEHIYWHHVNTMDGQSFYEVRFMAHGDDKKRTIETLLLRADASGVRIVNAEEHELSHRIAAASLGSGNKKSSLRFKEYIYYSDIIRAEPLKQDLDEYMDTTGYSMDVARADLLMAYKKWRQKISESK